MLRVELRPSTALRVAAAARAAKASTSASRSRRPSAPDELTPLRRHPRDVGHGLVVRSRALALDRRRPRVVRRERELGRLEAVEQLAEVACAGEHVLADVIGVELELGGRRRQHLQQPVRAGRERASVSRFDSTLATATIIASGRSVSLAAARNSSRRSLGTGHGYGGVSNGSGAGAGRTARGLPARALSARPTTVPETVATSRGRAFSAAWGSRIVARDLQSCERARDQRAGDLDLVRRPGRGVAASRAAGESSSQGTGAAPESAIRSRRRRGPQRPRRGRTPTASGPSPSGRRSIDLGHVELEDQLAGLERRRRAVVVGRQPVELGEAELAAVGADRAPRASSAAAGSEGCADAQRSFPKNACSRCCPPWRGSGAAVQIARELEAPVPAARRLEQVAADRAHVAELRRGGEPACLPERRRNLRIGFELGERRPGADRAAR